MITTEKSAATVNASALPPSYDSVVPQAQSINDEKNALPSTRAPAYTASSSSKPDSVKQAPMTETECIQSGGHVIHTEYFEPGEPIALATAVAIAMWKGKPVFCERCHKDLYEEDLQVIWEKMEETHGKRKDNRKGKACGEGGGFYDRRCGKERQSQALPSTEAPAYTASSSSKPDSVKQAPMTETECIQSGGHVIHTEYFKPGGPMAIATTVAVAMWKGKPVFCERCHKDLYEEDLQVIWEKIEETCTGGKKRDHRKGKAWGEGGGFYDRRCGKEKQSS